LQTILGNLIPHLGREIVDLQRFGEQAQLNEEFRSIPLEHWGSRFNVANDISRSWGGFCSIVDGWICVV
jgi:hypothetical protein